MTGVGVVLIEREGEAAVIDEPGLKLFGGAGEVGFLYIAGGTIEAGEALDVADRRVGVGRGGAGGGEVATYICISSPAW